MRYLSVCSRIEAATQAWHPLGWTPVAFSEIEPFPCAVLAHHYPHVPNWGDMTKFEEWPDANVDVLCGGTPCQSFSVAGLRKGLADPRGNLMLTFGAIAARYRPRWLVWENVPGVLSSNGGRDFGTFLGMLGELGYGVAYRVLDAQHVRTRRFPFAVPQRRRRVFVVGYFGDWRRAAAVLFDRESLSGHPAPRREAGQRASRGAALGVAIRGREGGGTAELTGPLATALRASQGGGDKPHVITSNSGEVGYCLTASAQQSLDAETETLLAVAHTLLGKPNDSRAADLDTYVAHALRGEGFDASNGGTGRRTPLVPVMHPTHEVVGTLCAEDSPHGGRGLTGLQTMLQGYIQPVAIQEAATRENPDAGPDGVGVRQDGASYTLEARQVPQAVAFAQNTRDEVRLIGGDGGVVGALAAEPGMKQTAYVAFDMAQLTSPQNGSIPQPVAPTMAKGSRMHTAGPTAWSIMPQNSGKDYKARQVDVAQPLMAGGPVGGNQGGDYIQAAWQVRRLTPVECERLQGFPDDFTRIPYRNKPADACPDGPRYKALGNSWAVNAAEWIGERIAEVDRWEAAE